MTDSGLMRLHKRLRVSGLCFLIGLSSLMTTQADVRILLDVSQSMAENDPQNFRRDALQLLIDRIPDGEKAGVWTFGQFVNLLVPHQEVNDQWRGLVNLSFERLGAPATRTNMGRVLEEAAYDFLFSTYDGGVHVVLVTDGRVDIAPNNEVNGVERERILSQLVPQYVAADARIHTIAISEDADHALLRQMSEQTGGQYQKVTDSQNLSRVLSALSTEVSPSNQLALRSKSFDVDSSISELTVLMYHSSGAVSLVAPNGAETSAIAPSNQRWRVGNGFTQVTLSAPMTGRWQVKGDIEGQSNIRVISDINVDWLQPISSAVARGNLLSAEARVTDSEGNSIARDLSSLVTAELRVNGQSVPVNVNRNSITGRIVPPEGASAISLELSINGGTFNRLMTRQVRFVSPYISEVLMTESGYEWRIYPNRYLDDVENIQAMAEFERDGTQMTEPFTETEAGYWVWVLPFDAPQGSYDVTLSGQLTQQDMTAMLPPEMIQLQLPAVRAAGMAVTPSLALPLDVPAMETMPEMPMGSGEFVKDPMPEFAMLQPDLVVEQPAITEGEWNDEPLNDSPIAEDSDGIGLMTYVLLTIPGVLVLVVAYLFYRRLEQKTKETTSEDELMLGGDEFAGLDDMNSLQPDSDLDISSLDDEFDLDDPMPNAPVIDDIEELPTPAQTEAPTPAEEDMLDAEEAPAVEEIAEDISSEDEEELFDISSIDDDLADLDLALDGDDPFADAEEEEKN